jgi:predicted  nucleic acid-binding Zn-ribbon protein
VSAGVQVVAPKRQRVGAAEAELATANRKLADKQEALQRVESRVQALQQQLARAQKEQRDLNEQVRAGAVPWAQMHSQTAAQLVV